MDNFLLVGGLMAGLAVSQGITWLRQIETLLKNSELKKEQRIQELALELRDAFEMEKVKHEKYLEEVCRRPLEEKSAILDQKLSLVLAKITSSSGSYKTHVSLEQDGLKQAKEVKELVEKAGGQLSENFTKVLEKFAPNSDDRKGKEPEFGRTERPTRPLSSTEDGGIVWSELPEFQNMTEKRRESLVKEILDTPEIEECHRYFKE